MFKATFDSAVNLDLYFRKNRNGSKVFRFFDADGVEYELTDEFEFRADFDLTLVIQNGNEWLLSVLAAGVDEVRNSYFYEIVNTTTGKTWFCGTAYFTDSYSSDIQNTTDVTLYLEGDPVEVTLLEAPAGGGGIEHFQGGFDASGNTFPGDADTVAGDWWRFTVGGSPDGTFWPAKTFAYALTDNPGQDPDNWRLI
jgi:hypothetical protein